MNKVYCYCCCYSIRCSMLHFPCCTQLCRFIVLSNMYSYNPVSLCLTQGAIHSVVHVGQIQQAIHVFHSVSPKVLFIQLSMLVRFNKLFMHFTLSHPRCYSFSCPCWSDLTSYSCVSFCLTQGAWSTVHVGLIKQAIHVFHSVSPRVLFVQLSMLV